MAEIQTDFYPKATQNNLLEIYQGAANLRNMLIQNQRQQVGLSQDKINQAHQGYQWLSQGLGSLAQDPRIATPEGPALLKQFADQGMKQGWLTPEVANAEIANAPTNPAELPQYLQNLNVRAQDAAGQFAKIYGEPTFINDGTQSVPAAVSPITGIRQIGAPIQQTLTPADRGALVSTVDAQGRTILQPKGSVLQQAGVNPLTAMPETAPNGPANRLVPGTDAPSGVVASPAAGTVEAQTALGAAAGSQLAEDTARERNFQSDIVPLVKARDALVALGPTGTGPGTEQINEVKSFLTSMGIIGPSDSVKSFDEARKYLTQYASQAGNPNTNDKLAAAFAGNPNVGISNAASVDVLKTALSLRRLQNAQVSAFNASGEPPASYSQWAAKFNADQDPVAYGFDMLSPADRSKYVKGLSAPERDKFRTSLQTAMELGLVTPPSGN